MGRILAIESSCDDTCAAVLDGLSIRSNIISSQIKLHKKWGGVVPEAAARAHVEAIIPVVQEALEAAKVGLESIEGIAVTNRPGLIGSLSVGVAFAKGLAMARNIPWLGVHHLEGHLWSVLGSDPTFRGPSVTLIVSGGHTELVQVDGPGRYHLLGQTRDDAAGEAFDKCARLLSLPAPGGVSIQSAASGYDGQNYPLPQARVGALEFSFSGLKTAVRNLVQSEGTRLNIERAAASIQAAIVEPLVKKTIFAAEESGSETVCVVGGVSANLELRHRLGEECQRIGVRFLSPPLELCTDNGAMIGLAGFLRLELGEQSGPEVDVLASAPLP